MGIQTSDSWLSKNIRPLVPLVFSGFVGAIILLSAFGLSVAPTIEETVKSVLMVTIGFYFGSRGTEKANATKSKVNNE